MSFSLHAYTIQNLHFYIDICKNKGNDMETFNAAMSMIDDMKMKNI